MFIIAHYFQSNTQSTRPVKYMHVNTFFTFEYIAIYHDLDANTCSTTLVLTFKTWLWSIVLLEWNATVKRNWVSVLRIALPHMQELGMFIFFIYTVLKTNSKRQWLYVIAVKIVRMLVHTNPTHFTLVLETRDSYTIYFWDRWT